MNSLTRRARHIVASRNKTRSWVAEYNLASQERLLSGLCIAYDDGSYSLAEIAESIGTTPDVIEEALTGARDLNLTEVRHLAMAMNSVVEYRVVRAADMEDEPRLLDAIKQLGESAWDPMQTWDDATLPAMVRLK